MTVQITDQPGTNSYLTALIESYKKNGFTVLCGLHNFFYSNLKPDVLHIQWPEKLYNWYPFSALEEKVKIRTIADRLKWYKNNNVLIIHTIHNVVPHVPDNTDFEDNIFRLIITSSDILVHHCSASVDILKNKYSEALDKKSIICPHGDYSTDYSLLSKNDARKKLNIPKEKFVVLNFGNQLKYKNEKFIDAVFKALPIKEKYLLTAGNGRTSGYSMPFRIIGSALHKLKMKFPHSSKKYIYKVIPPDELPAVIHSADVFFLAHSGNNLNSGVLALAATYSVPVIFPDIGCFKEQMRGWNYETYVQGNMKDAVGSLIRMYKRIKSGNLPFDNSQWLIQNSWDIHVKNIFSAIQENLVIQDAK